MNDDITFDFDREKRIGVPEIVYGESKTADQLVRVVTECQNEGLGVLISRCDATKAESLRDFENGIYDTTARTWTLRDGVPRRLKGTACIISGGTADAPVVAETANTLDFLGIKHQRIQDVGVAGVHRLLDRLDEIRHSDVVICVAGFEGALASVVSGQVGCPVIGVPTSVGYGVGAEGKAALHAMLASCASGLVVMNIDNGIGAALATRRILNLKETKS